MDYISIFDMPDMKAILISIFQTATLFFLVLVGLKAVGRRIFAEKSPQDLVILVLIAEACDLGLTDEKAGYWGTIASVLTLLFLGWLCEKVPFIRQSLSSKPVLLFKDGRLYRERLESFMMDESDLHEAARARGLSSYTKFAEIYLEGDGKITGLYQHEES